MEAIIKGRDLVTGLPKEVVITDTDVQPKQWLSRCTRFVESVKRGA